MASSPFLFRGLAAALLVVPAWAQEPAEPPPPPTEPEQEEILEAVPVEIPAPEEIFGQGVGGYRIGRQDLLELRVFDLQELNQTVRVSDDGSITLPLLGRLAVAGLTKSELENLIARLLGERYVRDPQVTIFVKEYESRKVAVSGAVRNPDTYEMLGEKTLLEMISMAGGLSGDLGQEIVVFRRRENGTERVAVDLEGLVYQADPALNLIVEPGDIIYVPEVERVRIFVSGAVAKPNLYEVPRDQPITVLKAITLAGGTTERAAESRVQVLRAGPGGQKVALAIDLRKIKRGKADDVVLQKDDVVLVPESYF